MIERASEFGASAAMPLMPGDTTHLSAGAMLRQAREAHNLHLEAVAAALKVPPQKLQAPMWFTSIRSNKSSPGQMLTWS